MSTTGQATPFTRIRFCGLGDYILGMVEEKTRQPQQDCRAYCKLAQDDRGECISYDLSVEES